MSIAAAAALFTTGAMAFDATQGDGQLMKETGATSAVLGTYTNVPNAPTPAANAIVPAAPGKLGDALIYPAFFGQNGFSTEFSVINTSSTEAMVAKVVLYSAVDSKELRDFNIYLSANDVFRATIKDGKIVSTDGSTVVPGTDSLTAIPDHLYNYKDASTMASKTTPFETTLDEQIGYIAVFGMAQVDKAATDALQAGVNTAYHKMHNKLWRDYRHLMDQCRSDAWRGGITNGIYTGAPINQPNINLATAVPVPPLAITAPSNGRCSTLSDTVQSTTTTGPLEVVFKAPDALLTGSLTVKGNDAKGTRAMTIKPVPYTNFSDGTNTVLWTEGELASIADRCIEFTAAGATKANYKATCIDADSAANRIAGTLYEFGSLESKLLVTQPWKRTIIQMNGDGGFAMADAGAWTGVTRQTVGNGITAGTTVPADDFNVKNYGGFKISQFVYNDDEDKYIGSAGGFTVSPASTASAGTIPNEMSMFDPLPGGANYEKGYAQLSYLNNMHGIVTQMTANEIDGTAEINWLYPYTN